MLENVRLKDGCMYSGNTANRFRINFFIGNIHLSPSCEGNVQKLSRTVCMHACTHCLPFLRRRVLRLIMDPSKYQSTYTAWILGLKLNKFIIKKWSFRKFNRMISAISLCRYLAHDSPTKRARPRHNFNVVISVFLSWSCPFCRIVACFIALSIYRPFCHTVVGEITTERNYRNQPLYVWQSECI